MAMQVVHCMRTQRRMGHIIPFEFCLTQSGIWRGERKKFGSLFLSCNASRFTPLKWCGFKSASGVRCGLIDFKWVSSSDFFLSPDTVIYHWVQYFTSNVVYKPTRKDWMRWKKKSNSMAKIRFAESTQIEWFSELMCWYGYKTTKYNNKLVKTRIEQRNHTPCILVDACHHQPKNHSRTQMLPGSLSIGHMTMYFWMCHPLFLLCVWLFLVHIQPQMFKFSQYQKHL